VPTSGQVQSCVGRCGVRTPFTAEVRAGLTTSQAQAPETMQCQCDDTCSLVGDCCVDLVVACMSGSLMMPPTALYEVMDPFVFEVPAPISILPVPVVETSDNMLYMDGVIDDMVGVVEVEGPSCRGKCGHATPSVQDGDVSATCYCDSSCVLHDDCCSDYTLECAAVVSAWLDTAPMATANAGVSGGESLVDASASCAGRCGDAYDGLHQCYCDDACAGNKDCCPAYGLCT
jgi:hypothetical protein